MNSKGGIKMDTANNIKSKNEKHIIEKMPHWNKKRGTKKLGENHVIVNFLKNCSILILYSLIHFLWFISESKPRKGARYNG